MFKWYDKEMDWRWNIKNLYGTLTYPFRRFFRWIVKSIQYSIFLWNDYDWDHTYILRLLQYKLNRAKKCIEESNHMLRSYEIGAQIKHATDMIQKHFDDEWTDDLQDKHEEKWGKITDFMREKNINGKIYYLYDPQREKAITEEQKKQERQEQRDITLLHQKLYQENLDRLFAHIRKYIEWWSS